MWERLSSRDLHYRVELIRGWKAAPTFDISVYLQTQNPFISRN